jgi:hypothetical protein
VYIPGGLTCGGLFVDGSICQRPDKNVQLVGGVSATQCYASNKMGQSADIVIGTSTLHFVGRLFVGTTS